MLNIRFATSTDSWERYDFLQDDGESSHWHLDVHDLLKRKYHAYDLAGLDDVMKCSARGLQDPSEQTVCDSFLCGYVECRVYVPLLSLMICRNVSCMLETFSHLIYIAESLVTTLLPHWCLPRNKQCTLPNVMSLRIFRLCHVRIFE